jgi:hypothetical protein
LEDADERLGDDDEDEEDGERAAAARRTSGGGATRATGEKPSEGATAGAESGGNSKTWSSCVDVGFLDNTRRGATPGRKFGMAVTEE